MIRLVIFDIDGTIVDAYCAIQKSINFTLKNMGYRPIGLRTVKRAVGFGDRNFVERFVKPEDTDTALAIYRQHHTQAITLCPRVMPQAKRTLETLKRNGCILAIMSNRPGKFSKILLKNLKLYKYFDLIECAKNRRDIKPSPRLLLRILKKTRIKADESVYIGDMIIDVQAGKRAGIKSVAITGGSSYIYELERERPYKIIRRLNDLVNIVKVLNKNSK